MPTVHREKGYRFVIFVDDHEPAHIHAIKGDGSAKINIGSGETFLIEARNLTRAEISDALTIAQRQRAALLKAWRKQHGSQ